MTDETDEPAKSSEQSAEQKLSNSAPELRNAVKEAVSNQDTSKLFNAKPIPEMPTKRDLRSRTMSYIIGLLLAAALLLIGWIAYQQQSFQERWTQLQDRVNRQIDQQTQAIQQMKTSSELSLQATNRAQRQVNQLNNDNQRLKESLLSTQERIKSLSGRQKQDWMLAEAAYLIKVAQLQLGLQKDKTTAIQLLKSADTLILKMADNSLLPIREALAKDISDISLIIEADVTGVSLALNAISQQIPNLQIIALELVGTKGTNLGLNSTPSEAKDDSPEDGFFGLTTIYQEFLNDFVVIKDHSEPRKPLMTPDQRVNLNRNIQLAIQQAQIALAMGNETLYQLNLDNAILWSKEFFSQNDKTTQVINQLEEQKNKIVDAHYPSQLAAKQALDEISRQQLYQWLDASRPNNSSKVRRLNETAFPQETNSMKNNDENINGEDAIDEQQSENQSNAINYDTKGGSGGKNNSESLESIQ